jgi:hypothetical protein
VSGEGSWIGTFEKNVEEMISALRWQTNFVGSQPASIKLRK